MSIYLKYYDYAGDPSLSNASLLLDSIINERGYVSLDRLQYRDESDYIRLFTNNNRSYRLGPNGKWWLYKLEHRLKDGHLGYTITIDDHNFLSAFTVHKPEIIYCDDNPLIRAVVKIDLRYDFTALVSIINELYETHGIINIILNPNVAMFILTHKELRYIVEELIRLKIVRRIITINSDPFYPTCKNVYDTMINWETGLNHYYCDFGRLHMLPLMSTIFTNLLCAHKPMIQCDDLCHITSMTLCECGLTTLNREFIPHLSNQVKVNGEIIRPMWIADELTECYLNLQFHQVGDIINIHYVTMNDNNSRDIDLIRDYLRTIGSKTLTHKNSAFRVGYKHPAFWNGQMKKIDIKL